MEVTTMNFKDDFGYFGSGLDGYVHYKQAFDNSFSALDDLSFTPDCDDSSDDGEEDFF